MMLNGKIRSTPRRQAAAGRAGHLARDLPRHENAVLRRQAGPGCGYEPESGSAAQLEDVRGDVDVILRTLSPAGQGSERRLAVISLRARDRGLVHAEHAGKPALR